MVFIVFDSCKIGYSFTGASISPEVKTYSIYDFPNRARLVNPTMSDYFVEKLRERFTRQTSLNYLNDNGDLEFEGAITGYEIQPMAIKTDDQASMNRLTARISVKFTNNKNHDQDFETEFSAYSEYSSDQLLSDVEDGLVETIVKQIIEDVYNKSVANW
jgi:hypothetical protein